MQKTRHDYVRHGEIESVETRASAGMDTGELQVSCHGLALFQHGNMASTISFQPSHFVAEDASVNTVFFQNYKRKQ